MRVAQRMVWEWISQLEAPWCRLFGADRESVVWVPARVWRGGLALEQDSGLGGQRQKRKG